MTYQTVDSHKDKKTQSPAAKTKPAPIENWENEGGQVIPTGSLPKVTFPKDKPAEQEKEDRHS